jgi:GT2 family glycosyltransferase
MSVPFFSVIVPTHSRPERLATCLDGLGRLSYPPERFEVIVVDDGSEREPQVEEAGSLRLRVVRQEHAGPAAARNRGAAQADGDHLAFLDDDCVPHAGWLTAFADRFSKLRDPVLGGSTVNGLPDNAFSTASQLLVSYLYAYHRRGETSQPPFFTSNNLALTAASFRRLGGFSTKFRLAAGEDRELCARAVDAGLLLEYVPDAIVAHSHPLGLRSFSRQHFDYGRGAFDFHRQRNEDRLGAGLRPEPARFYFGLVSYPFATARRRSRLVLGALLALSQVATATGFLREALSNRQPTMMKRG